jgi:protein-disulfide isomerase
MKKVVLLIGLVALLMANAPALAKTEWTMGANVELSEKPIDMALSADGTTAYILTKKNILIYNVQGGMVTDTIPLDKTYNSIAASQGNVLLLTSGSMFNKSISSITFTKTLDLPVGTSPVIGPVDARVTLTMFTDYQCPYCSKEYPEVEKLLKKYPNDFNLVIKHFPLGMHKFAQQAAIAALAADKQGKYADLSRVMFENFRALNEELLQKLAKEVGLDMDKFEQDRKDSAFQKQLNDDRQLGKIAGVRGVPSLFINGVAVKDRSFEGMSAMIDAQLKNK